MPGSNPNSLGGFTLGNFSAPTSRMTSEERFAISQSLTSGRSGQATNSDSKGDPGGKRMRSKRNRVCAANMFNQAAEDQGANFEPVTPLEVSANRWRRKAPASGGLRVERKVLALLNKLTMEKFDPLSDQIVEWANKSEAE